MARSCNGVMVSLTSLKIRWVENGLLRDKFLGHGPSCLRHESYGYCRGFTQDVEQK